MTPDERQLITDLFDRMRNFGQPEKDPQAEALINQSVRALPDSAYLLVQTLLVRESELQQGDERIQDLEARVAELEGQHASQTGGRSGGSFLGGAAPRGSSVPSMGTGPRDMGAPQASPWASGSRQPVQQPQAPTYQPPVAQQPAPQASGGGGFFRSAVAAAAGMAGGVMMADSIKGMMGGGSHNKDTAGTNTGGADNEYTLKPGGANKQTASNESNDPGNYDAPAADDLSSYDTSDPGSGSTDE